LAEAYENGRKVFFEELKKISRLMVLGGLLWWGILFFLGAWIVVPLFGPNFGKSVPYLKVFSFVGLMVFLNYVATHIMVIIEKQMRHAVHQVLAFLTCLAMSVALASNYEAMGMALALLGAESLLFFLTIIYLFRFFNGKNKDVGFARIPPHGN
jgi:O-antigen/teichoic acid export membrane protein